MNNPNLPFVSLCDATDRFRRQAWEVKIEERSGSMLLRQIDPAGSASFSAILTRSTNEAASISTLLERWACFPFQQLILHASLWQHCRRCFSAIGAELPGHSDVNNHERDGIVLVMPRHQDSLGR